MNDKLIEQLAAELGTTSKYLWMVLIKEAPIDATITLLQIIAIALYGFVLFKIHKKLCASKTYQYEQFGYGLVMVIGVIIFGILGICCIMNGIQCVIDGYFNPEFWALNYITHHLK